MRPVTIVVVLFIGAFLMFGAGAWGILAINFYGPGSVTLRILLASIYAVISLAALEGDCTRRVRWISAIFLHRSDYCACFLVECH